MWKKPPPCSRKRANSGHSEEGKRTKKVKRQSQNKSVKEKLLKGFYSRLIYIYKLNVPP